MLKGEIFTIKKLARRLSVRASAFAVFAVITSLVAVLFDDYVPNELSDLVGGKAVDGILSVMASSMLVVVTFALSTLVSAYSTATQVSPPRATTLLIDDPRSHSAISVFLGAFIYSIVSLIALSTGYYGEKGRVLLLLITVLLLAAVVWTIIRWVEELKNMGSVSETIRRVEKLTTVALEDRVEQPTFGCNIIQSIPNGTVPVPSLMVGHIQNIDISRLAKIADEHSLKIYIVNEVGAFIHYGSRLASIVGIERDVEVVIKEIRECFITGDRRTFNSDPRYGISVLAGIAIKALSPSLNDPGTAIDVVGSLVRVLSSWEKKCEQIQNHKVIYERIYFPELSIHDLFNDAFYGLAKEGANHLEVIKTLQQGFDALAALENKDFSRAVAEHRLLVDKRASEELSLAEDLKNLHSSHMIGETQRDQSQSRNN